MLENWLNFSSEKFHKANTTLKNLKEKNKDKKKSGNSTTQSIVNGESERMSVLFYFNQCVSTVRFIISAVGVLGGTQNILQTTGIEGILTSFSMMRS